FPRLCLSQQPVRRRGLGFGRLGGLLLAHFARDLGKVSWIAEVLVDARKSYVGDMVEGLEPGHHGLADPRGRYLVAHRLHLPLDAAHETINLRCVDLALARRVADRSGELVAVERFALSVLLDDREVAQLDPLERGETCAA